jgi:hypothetical protein
LLPNAYATCAIKYYRYWLFFIIVDSAGIPSRNALNAVSATSACPSFTPSRIPVRMVYCKGYSNRKLNYFSCSQIKPIVKIDTYRTTRS